MRIVDGIRDSEILGLRGTTNGRSCEQHACCGTIERPNDCVRFKASVVPIDGFDQAWIKADLILDGTELCTVGFLGKNIAALKKTSDNLVKKLAQVIELYDCIENADKGAKSNNNLGVCSFRFLEPRTS
jgi:hypothetical protein